MKQCEILEKIFKTICINCPVILHASVFLWHSLHAWLQKILWKLSDHFCKSELCSSQNAFESAMQLLLKTQINTDSNNNVAFCSTPELKKKANMFCINRSRPWYRYLEKMILYTQTSKWISVVKGLQSEKLYCKLVIYLISHLQQRHSE